MFCALVFSALFVLGNVHASPNELYNCFVCTVSVENSFKVQEPSLFKSCSLMFGAEGSYICDDFKDSASVDLSSLDSARSICEERQICGNLEDEEWKTHVANLPTPDPNDLDVRISKGYGSRGYDSIRISVISHEPIPSPLFSYSYRFKYRWTHYFLNTGVVTVVPGEKNTFRILNDTISVMIPKENDPVRGVIVADPCFSSQFVWCTYGEKMHTFNRSVELLNAIHAHEDSDFWMILGDNFYDVNGNITQEWFGALSKETKSRVYGTLPGNHDFWVLSAPVVWIQKVDQLGNGFMQWNGQDVAASVVPSSDPQAVPDSPYDFVNDPDAEDADSQASLPPLTNFFSYYKMGNVGFISYSGAHDYISTAPYLEEACDYFNANPPDAVLLLGHWNSRGLGCSSDMSVPEFYKEILEIPSCSGLGDKLRYVMGHLHCNTVVEPDVGFMVAGQGMTAEHLECDGKYGLPFVDTYGGNFSIYYFDIQKYDEYDNYDVIIDCIKTNGISQCYHLAEVWTSVPL